MGWTQDRNSIYRLGRIKRIPNGLVHKMALRCKHANKQRVVQLYHDNLHVATTTSYFSTTTTNSSSYDYSFYNYITVENIEIWTNADLR